VRIDFQDPFPQSFFLGTRKTSVQVRKCFVILLMNGKVECLLQPAALKRGALSRLKGLAVKTMYKHL
jgi:hypothetical protein